MRPRYWWLGCALLLPALAGLASEGATADAAGVWQELEPAWDVVANKVTKLVGEERQRRLIDLAYASVGANVCGLALRRDAFEQAFDLFQDAAYRGLPEPQQKQYEQHLLIHYGTIVGLLTAEALLGRETFCSAALKTGASGTGAGAYWEEHPAGH